MTGFWAKRVVFDPRKSCHFAGAEDEHQGNRGLIDLFPAELGIYGPTQAI
jgi:hypothetical protein